MEGNVTGLGIFCGSEGAEWTLTVIRLTLNMITVVVAMVMLFFICSTPALHHSTFNILFLTSYVVDSLANLSRIFLKYLPLLLCHHSFVHKFFGIGPSLATLMNATEWYLTYVTICCGFFFNLDHMLLVVFPAYYHKISNFASKMVMVFLTWFLPLFCVLPMFSSCCGSVFFEHSMNPVFQDKNVEDVYDTVDMLLESFVYVPLVFMFNCVSTTVLQWRYRRSKHKPNGGNLRLLVDQMTLQVPSRNGQFWNNTRRTVLHQRKIVDELDISLLNLVDQMIDAVGVVFYMLFWAGNNNWIKVDATWCMSMYDLTWEISTVNQPYLFLFMFPKVRRKLLDFYRIRRSRQGIQRQSTLNSSMNLS